MSINVNASKTKPKILYVINHIDWFWSHRLPLALAAQKDGFDVHVAVSGAGNDQKLSDNGFFGHEIPVFNGVFSVFRVFLALYLVVLKEKPDVLHAITLKYAFITGLVSLFFPKTRIVHTIAGLGYLFSGDGLKPKILRIIIGPFLKLALRRKKTVLIFQNPDDMALMISRGFASKEQSHLIRGSGVDLSQYRPTPEPAGDIVVGMPTRLLKDKGIAVFIATARILEEQGVRVLCRIAGGVSTSNPRAISEQEMHESIQGAPVQWLGKVSDMPGFYNDCHIIAYPSHYREGVPKVLLEALASARPIITTDHPGCRETVQDGVNGFLIPVKDAASLASAIKELVENKNQRVAMGKKGRELAEKAFDVNIVCKKTIALYH